MKRDLKLKAKLFSIRGDWPKSSLRNALDYFAAENLSELERRIDSGELDRFSFSRLRGCGSKESPGILLQYLFGVRSGQSIRAEKIDAQWGHGEGI